MSLTSCTWLTGLSRDESREWATIFDWVNAEEGGEELRRLRQSVVRSQSFGKLEWVSAMIEQFDLFPTIRNEGRPGKSARKTIPGTVSVPAGDDQLMKNGFVNFGLTDYANR